MHVAAIAACLPASELSLSFSFDFWHSIGICLQFSYFSVSLAVNERTCMYVPTVFGSFEKFLQTILWNSDECVCMLTLSHTQTHTNTYIHTYNRSSYGSRSTSFVFRFPLHFFFSFSFLLLSWRLCFRSYSSCGFVRTRLKRITWSLFPSRKYFRCVPVSSS